MTTFKISDWEVFENLEKKVKDHEIQGNELLEGYKLIPRLACNTDCKLQIENYDFTDWAMAQFRTKLGISKFTMSSAVKNSYTKKLPDLTKDIAITFLKYYHRKLLLRFGYPGTSGVRAVLSENYAIYNNSQMMKMLKPYVISNGNKKMYLLDYYIDDYIFSFRILLKKWNIAGETWWVGLRFANSEVGASRIRMDMILYKLVCTNGLIIPQSKYKLVDKIHFRINKGRLQKAVEDGFKNFFTYGDEIKEKIEGSYDIELDTKKLRPLISTLRNFLARFEIGMDVLERKMIKYPPNYYGYANALSEISQGYENKEGEYIEIPFSQKQLMDEFAGNIILMAA